MDRTSKAPVRDALVDGRGPVALHFHFPGEDDPGALLDWALHQGVEEERFYSLNGYLHPDWLGRMRVFETPTVLVYDGGREVRRAEGSAPHARPPGRAA